MKKKIITLTIFAAMLVSMTIIAYRIGWQAGHKQTLPLNLGTFSYTLSILKLLEKNNVKDANTLIQNLSYAKANSLLESEHDRNNKCVKHFIIELVDYRSRNATNESKWTPMEKILEDHLVEQGWKTNKLLQCTQ